MAARVALDGRVSSGGIGRYARDLVAALKRLGDPPQLALIERGTGVARVASAPFTPWGRRYVVRHARGADLLHSLHLELPRALALPKIVTIHDVIPLEHPASMPNPVARRVFAYLLGSALAVADRVIVPSEATDAALTRRGCPAGKIRVIPNGVGANFRPATEGERRAARNAYARGRRYVATVAHDKAHKNASVLPALAQSLARGHDVTLVAAGTTKQALVEVLKVGWLGDDDLRRFYGGAEAFVLPSLVEGFGLPALEALACGTPVVCGRGVGAFPYIEGGVVEADPTDSASLAAAVAELLEHEELRHDLSEAGLEIAARLTTDFQARSTAKVYAEVLEGR